MQDYKNGLRETASLTNDEIKSVDDAAGALYDHKQALELNKKIGDELATTITKIAMNFKSLQSAVTDLLNSIAQQLIKTQVATPLANSIAGLMPVSAGTGSLFSGIGGLLGFADGGSPPVGVPSIVGENGPELFVPNSAGTVVPNGNFGGARVNVTQVFNMQPGLAETVGAAIRSAAPHIAAMSIAGMTSQLQSGGSLSKAVGLRS
jgi:hypothetical protein